MPGSPNARLLRWEEDPDAWTVEGGTARVLASYTGDRLDYLLVTVADGHLRVVEKDADTGKSRGYRVSSEEGRAVMGSASPYAAAADLYHKARLAQKARRMVRASGACDEQTRHHT